MLTIRGGAQKGFCDGISRRGFMQVGAFGAGVTLADMLRGQAAASNAAVNPGTTRAKSAIMVYLPGGPTHMDMYDLKPNAPAEFRGEFNPINTNVTGVQICEHFPEQAKIWDKLAVIRSVVAVNEHSDSLVMTGKSQQQNMIANHPSFGSVVSRVRGEGSMPPFVSLRGMSRGTEPGFLGINHRPFSPSGQGVQNLAPQPSMAGDRLSDRRSMLTSFDSVRRDIDNSVAGLDNFTARAFDMIGSGAVRRALDLTNENSATRQRYQGVESFLTARRLVEAGVGCVTLSYGGWDTHSGNFTTLKRQLPPLDRAIANLVKDLHDRGLQDDVVLVMWGEFGRTPRINMNAGRDHWPSVMSALIAGGGLKMGQAIGASTSRGETPQDRRYSVPQVLATLYQAIGINPATTFNNSTGRPIHIVDDREVVRELV